MAEALADHVGERRGLLKDVLNDTASLWVVAAVLHIDSCEATSHPVKANVGVVRKHLPRPEACTAYLKRAAYSLNADEVSNK
ncbi:MAG: hypothetical protein CMI16_13170 [Opitutaceae bacterium]|nr:hypothetical protein [Opitutaceae bacterium]